MGYCGPRGIPHSHFLGGPGVWTPLDREKAIWWMVGEAEKCPSCRTKDAEWDPELGGDIHAYTAKPHWCAGCAAKGSAEQRIKDSDEPGLSIRLERNPAATRG